jgi:hypothetical protein
MTVVTHRRDAFCSRVGDPCTFCGKPVSVPYVEWMAAPTVDNEGWEDPTTVIVCAKCAPGVLRGLGRDLREVVDETRRTSARDNFRKFCCQPVAGAWRQ